MFVEESYWIPAEATASLSSFRQWALSDNSPRRGRFDFIDGDIEVEWEPEDLFTHGTLKGELIAGIGNHVSAALCGYVFTRERFSSSSASLSAQPDVMFVGFDSIESGSVRLVPKSADQPDRYVEIEGPPDLVAEVVSERTDRRDTRRLPQAYFAAGVREFWLADGRKDLKFVLHRRGRSAFEPVEADAEGFQPSDVLVKAFRLDRTRDRIGEWRYDLISR